ncbi:integrase, partial [Pseudomonas sp. O39]
MKRGVESIGSLFGSGNFSVTCEPDNAPVKISKPGADFVLCRSANGQPTAIYGQSVWDFNPYRLSANKISRISFVVFDNQDDEQNALVEEAKYLLYCLIYFGGGGRLGKLSVATLYRYWGILRGVIQFGYAQKQKPIVGVLSLQQIFSTPVYLASAIREQFSGTDRSALSGLLSQLVRVGRERIGYDILNPNRFDLRRPESKQYPVIPTRIYLNLINVVADLLDQLYEGVGSYQSFVKSFSDEHYGINLRNQKGRKLGGKANYRPDMAQALREHGLEKVLVDEFQCDFKKDVQTVLLKIQHLAKTVIHLYTGMREQEVMRMSYSCLSSEISRPPVIDDHGLVRDQPLTVMVISSTTKFTGYRKEGTWYAPVEVIKAVEVAQAV